MAWRKNVIVRDDQVTPASQLTLRQSLVPCGLVTCLFFLWGFAYGLLDVLNSNFVSLLDISNAESSGLSAAYFGAYFLCPLTISGWILRRYGFRITFVCGLCVLCVGCLLFWPSGVKQSFGGFCGSMFVVGAGLSTLETAADPFLSICGPPKYSEVRLNLAQAVQGVGSMAAPLLASYVFFKDISDTADGLQQVQWVYLGVACFVVLLAIVFFFAPMPEVTDADMAVMEQEIGEVDPGSFWKQKNLFLGTFSQFCYVGAQVAVANYFIKFCEQVGHSAASSSALLSAAQGIYAGMRFLSSFAMLSPHTKPRLLLLAFLGLCFAFALAAMNTTGPASVALLMAVFAFESACFATIFTLALRGLGRHTKRGGSLQVAAISGGMVFPPVMGAVVDARGAHFALVVPAVGYVLASSFPLYVNFWNARIMDSHRETLVNVERLAGKELELEKGGGGEHVEEVR